MDHVAQALMKRPPKTAATPRNGTERREEILKAATDLFYERGFENGAMRDIAATLEFTQAALYYHFKNKDEILFSILDGFTEMVFQSIREELDKPADPVTVLRGAMKKHVTLSRDFAKEVKLLIEDRKLLSEESARRVRVKERKIFELYRRHFEKLRAGGLIAPISPTVMTFAVLAAVNSVYQWFDRNGALSIEDIAAELFRLFVGEASGEPNTKRKTRAKAS